MESLRSERSLIHCSPPWGCKRILRSSRFRREYILLIFQLEELLVRRAARDDLYLQFLSVQSMSVGLYELKAGASDPQKPHGEDEVYYILKGSGSIRVG